MKTCVILFLALLSGAGSSAADAICNLELLDRAGPHWTAVLTKNAETAVIEYDQRSGRLYPVKYECRPSRIPVCVNETPWSLHVISFEYPTYALTFSVFDREAYGYAETVFDIRVWKMKDCIGDMDFN